MVSDRDTLAELIDFALGEFTQPIDIAEHLLSAGVRLPAREITADRDTLEDLLLNARVDAKTTDETADDILGAGWRPPAQRIETAEALEALPVGTIVGVDDGRMWQRKIDFGKCCWFEPGWTGGYTSAEAMLRVKEVGATVRVLFTPDGES